jgi:hypothetical protein
MKKNRKSEVLQSDGKPLPGLRQRLLVTATEALCVYVKFLSHDVQCTPSWSCMDTLKPISAMDIKPVAGRVCRLLNHGTS